MCDCCRLLLPGGGAKFSASDGYSTAGWQLYELAKEKNDAGVYFPVWGTCLGFELLFVLSANQNDIRSVCNIVYTPMSLTFRPGKYIFREPSGYCTVVILYTQHHLSVNRPYVSCMREVRTARPRLPQKYFIYLGNKDTFATYGTIYSHHDKM